MSAPTLRGARVALRSWTEADLAPFAAMNADPEVMRHLTKPLTVNESDAMAGRIRAHIHVHGFGLWAIDVPKVGFAGFVGLAQVPFELDAQRISLTRRSVFDHPRLALDHPSLRHVPYAIESSTVQSVA